MFLAALMSIVVKVDLHKLGVRVVSPSLNVVIVFLRQSQHHGYV
jgi:hypothetical protein